MTELIKEIVNESLKLLVDENGKRVPFERMIAFAIKDNKIIASKILREGKAHFVNYKAMEYFDFAKENGCTDFIMVHNHNNSDPLPSADDIISTATVVECAPAFNVKFIDHIIIHNKDSYYSFKEGLYKKNKTVVLSKTA